MAINLVSGSNGSFKINNSVVPRGNYTATVSGDKVSVSSLSGVFIPARDYSEYTLNGVEAVSAQEVIDWFEANAFLVLSGGASGPVDWADISNRPVFYQGLRTENGNQINVGTDVTTFEGNLTDSLYLISGNDLSNYISLFIHEARTGFDYVDSVGETQKGGHIALVKDEQRAELAVGSYGEIGEFVEESAVSVDADGIRINTNGTVGSTGQILSNSNGLAQWESPSTSADADSLVRRTNTGAVDTAEPQFPENAVPLSYLNQRIPEPPAEGNYRLESIDGVASWVEVV